MIVQCKCKCGTEFEEYNKWGHKREYVKGHQRRGKKHSPETKQLMSVNHADFKGEKAPMYGKHHSPEAKQLISNAGKDRVCSDITRQKLSVIHKGRIPWNKGLTKETNSSLLKMSKSKEGRIPWSKGLTKETNESLAKRAENIKGENHPMFGKHHSPEAKRKIGEKNEGKTCSDVTKRKIGEKNKGKHPSPETRQLMSEIRKDKYCGENHPNWKGGISKEPYCQEWTPWFKEEVKERDDFKCQNPDCDKEITKNNLLGVHHIDYNKKNCSTNNLITLCRSCNAKANFNREHWKEFYSNILIKN